MALQVWDMHSGEGFTSVEPNCGDINDVCVWPGTGLAFVATDSPHIGVYFTPSLGPAPAWCNFLESVVEDMTASEASGNVYDDYRFVTKEELARLELDHLLGTHLIRAYMHGFFIDNRLYHKARARVAPFEYEAFRAKRVAEKIEEERQSHISMVCPPVGKAASLFGAAFR
jgi:ribosome biogenesis protein ENP2